MSPKQTPFSPRDPKRPLMLSVIAAGSFALIAAVAGYMIEANLLVTFLVALFGSGIIAYLVWKNA